MPYVFSDELRDELLEFFKHMEKQTPDAKSQKFTKDKIKRIQLMPLWRKGQTYSNE